MSLSESQSITISGTALALPRTSTGANSSIYSEASGAGLLKVSHSYGKRNRRQVRFEHSKIAPDPLTAANTKFGMTASVLIDVPTTGYSITEQAAVVKGFLASLTDAQVLKILGGEN